MYTSRFSLAHALLVVIAVLSIILAGLLQLEFEFIARGTLLQTTSDSLRLRELIPTTFDDDNVIDVLPKYTLLIKLDEATGISETAGESGRWFKVRVVGTGIVGYVASWYVGETTQQLVLGETKKSLFSIAWTRTMLFVSNHRDDLSLLLTFVSVVVALLAWKRPSVVFVPTYAHDVALVPPHAQPQPPQATAPAVPENSVARDLPPQSKRKNRYYGGSGSASFEIPREKRE